MKNSIWGAYLEDYGLIKVIIPINIKFEELILQGLNYSNILEIEKRESFNNELYLYCKYNEDIKLYYDYTVIVNESFSFPLSLGKITRSKRFDEENYYDGVLGVKVEANTTEFNLWAPVCKEVVLVLNDEKYSLNYIDRGLWKISFNENLHSAKYYYLIRINSEFIRVTDPYGISCNSNCEYNYVVDLNKTYDMKYEYALCGNTYSNNFIYEMNFRDLTGNVSNRESLYLKAIDKLGYIKKLNVTHLQLMPTFCFGGVDETIKDNKDKKFKYNWGYNPVSYFCPSGWFSTDANDCVARINELKRFVDDAHRNNLAVNMDVVFNHVYVHETFSLGQIIPGYVYRTDDRGFLMNSSYCGNDIRTEGLMNRKFIIDCIKYYMNTYKIDGFRFDLMGLIDNETMIKVKEEVLRLNENAMIYGEGWYMNTTIKIDENANLGSAKKLYPIAFFNDYYRNLISGKMDGYDSFVTGNKIKPNILKDLLCSGSIRTMPFKNSNQSLNYIECHDNYTFYDKLVYLLKIKDENKLIDYCKLGIGLVLISEGIPFIHSGSELMRSKKGCDNSYNLLDDVNLVPWQNLNTKFDLSKYVSSLAFLRNKILNKNLGRCFYNDNHYEIRYDKDFYQIIIKNNYEEEDKYFVPGTKLIFNNNEIVDEVCESLKLDRPGIWILMK